MPPPPLPPEDSRPQNSVPPPLPVDHGDTVVTGIAGAEGLTHRQILDEISRGGRFVTFLYAVSVVILTFRRSTEVQFVRAGQTVGASAWGPTILTMVAGWWGIPWGPIFSIQAIFRNAMGGRDVTEAFLAPTLGTEGAKAALKLRSRPPAGAGLWSLRLLLLSIPAWFAGMIAIGSLAGAHREQEIRRSPGYDAWHSAELHLKSADDGNNPAANAAAKRLKVLLDSTLQLETKSGAAKKPKPFTVWCEFHERDTAVLVQWDDLRRVSKGDHETVLEMIWQAACLATRHEPDPGTGSPLTVGVKGQFQWDSAMIGKVPSAERIQDAKPAQTITGSEIEPRLISAFAPPAVR